MNRMAQDPLRGFRYSLPFVWTVLGAAGVVYAQTLGVSMSVAVAVIPAFLVEATLYVAAGVEGVRECAARSLGKPTLAAILVVSAVLPYCAYSLPTGLFRWHSLALLAALAAVVAFWYVLLPHGGLADVALMTLMAGVILGKFFAHIYADPAPRVTMSILGHLMWIRLGIVAMLALRRTEGVGLGFLPTRKEWSIGIRHYLYFLPAGLPLALLTGLARFEPSGLAWWKTLGLAIGTFLAMLWVVALSEEFFFRGLLQQWLTRWLASGSAALILTSVVFGLVHLPFRTFPNWRFALVAAVASWFYGRAYVRAGSVRAAMVAHALTNTTWRLFFS